MGPRDTRQWPSVALTGRSLRLGLDYAARSALSRLLGRPMCFPSRRIRAMPSRTPPRRQVGHSCSALDNIDRLKKSDAARRPHEARKLPFGVDQR